jgi:DMSO/TMAO reductase YedYZ molybdopterin-dependent catalytic subunit
MSETQLKVDGEVESPRTFSREQIAGLGDDSLIADVSQLEPRRQGQAVRLGAILEQVAPTPSATHLTLHASTDDFAASIPLDQVQELGILIFEINGSGLAASDGGPFRFLIPNAAACKTAEVDACANVKFLDRIELTAGPGKDTR